MVVIQSSEMTSLLTPKWFLDPSHFLFLWPVEGTTKWRVGSGEPLLAGNTRVARVTFFPHVEYKINISAKNTGQVPQWIGVFFASLNVTWLNFADDNWQLDYISECIYFLALGFAQLKRTLNIYYTHKFLNFLNSFRLQVSRRLCNFSSVILLWVSWVQQRSTFGACNAEITYTPRAAPQAIAGHMAH